MDMDLIKEMADQSYREEVLFARRIPPGEKLLDGPRLFDYACRITESGIRHQFPDATEEQVRQMLRERIELGRRLEANR